MLFLCCESFDRYLCTSTKLFNDRNNVDDDNRNNNENDDVDDDNDNDRDVTAVVPGTHKHPWVLGWEYIVNMAAVLY